MSEETPAQESVESASGPWKCLRNEYQRLAHECAMSVQAQNDHLFRAVRSHFGSYEQEWIDPFCALTGNDRGSVHQKRRSMVHQYQMARQKVLSPKELDGLKRRADRMAGVRDAVRADLESIETAFEALSEVRSAADSLRMLYPSQRELDQAMRGGLLRQVLCSRQRAVYRATRTLNRALKNTQVPSCSLDLSMKDARHYRDVLSWFYEQQTRIQILQHSVKRHDQGYQHCLRQIEDQQAMQSFLEENDPGNIDRQLFRMIMNRCWRKEGLMETLGRDVRGCPDMAAYFNAQARNATLAVLSEFFPDAHVCGALPEVARCEAARDLVREALACIPDHIFDASGRPFPEVAFFVDLMSEKGKDSPLWESFNWLAHRMNPRAPGKAWFTTLFDQLSEAFYHNSHEQRLAVESGNSI